MKGTKLVVLILFGFVACEPLPKDQEHFSKGFKAYEKGDYYTALLYLKPLVEEGNTAAELLMAKMYANGEGVQEDIGKAELLRNLAAAKIYSKPHSRVLKSANGTLKSVQDRLDYYVDGSKSGKNMPVEDVSQLLNSLDLNSIKQLAANDIENPATTEEKAPPEALPDLSPKPSMEVPKLSQPLPKFTEAPSSKPSETSPAIKPISLGQARNSNHISLTLLRQSANEKDPLAMELLSTAYAKGYYGLIPDPKQAALWREKAREVRANSSSSGGAENETDDSLPLYRLGAVAFAGFLFLGTGVWLAVKRWRHQRAS